MTKLRQLLILYTNLVLLTSCSTYNTFYSKTDTIKTFSSKSKRLNLKNLNLTSLPNAIENTKALRMLNLSGNTKLDINNALLKLPNPEKLEILILDSLKLRKLPNQIRRFSNLKQLSLVHNPNLELELTFEIIKELPITFLNLKDNALTRLPENITTIKTLKELNLSFNNLVDANTYTYLGKLPLLYSLWIDHNKLEQVPKTIGALNQLRFLYLGHNQLSELPQEMAKMKKLWVLHSEYNLFDALPELFIAMPSLLMVHANNNKIARFPKTYEVEKYSLKGLILNNNPILNTEREWAKKHFSHFFILSFEQN